MVFQVNIILTFHNLQKKLQTCKKTSILVKNKILSSYKIQAKTSIQNHIFNLTL